MTDEELVMLLTDRFMAGGHFYQYRAQQLAEKAIAALRSAGALREGRVLDEWETSLAGMVSWMLGYKGKFHPDERVHVVVEAVEPEAQP